MSVSQISQKMQTKMSPNKNATQIIKKNKKMNYEKEELTRIRARRRNELEGEQTKRQDELSNIGGNTKTKLDGG